MRLDPLSLVRGWRAALLFVVVVCASPERAAAECGDYVTILNSPSGSALHQPPNADDASTPARPPCHGPNCQGAPVRDLPPLVPVVPTGPQVKEQAQCLDVVDCLEASRESFDLDRSSSRPIHQPTSIFHPPRLG